MTGTEVARVVRKIEEGIAGIHTKLDAKPNWRDVERLEARRDAEQTKQDEAIKAVEVDVGVLSAKTDTAVNRVDSRINGLMMAVIVSALGATGSIIANLAG